MFVKNTLPAWTTVFHRLLAIKLYNKIPKIPVMLLTGNQELIYQHTLKKVEECKRKKAAISIYQTRDLKSKAQ